MGAFPIYSNISDTFSHGELTIGDFYKVVALKKKLSQCNLVNWDWMDRWPYHVKQYRDSGNRFIKRRKLPAAVIFASTSPTDRKKINERTGYYCIDIDYSDNERLFEQVPLSAIKQIIRDSFPSVSLMFASPSGNGLKVIHRIEPDGCTLKDHHFISLCVFEHFLKAYSLIGLNIDTKCKDWNRFCLLSYDREAYFNELAAAEGIMVIEPIGTSRMAYSGPTENTYQLSQKKEDRDQLCPRCQGGQHHEKTFTFYVNGNGTRLDGCGVCSRSKCGANIKPHELYGGIKWVYSGPIRR